MSPLDPKTAAMLPTFSVSEDTSKSNSAVTEVVEAPPKVEVKPTITNEPKLTPKPKIKEAIKTLKTLTSLAEQVKPTAKKVKALDAEYYWADDSGNIWRQDAGNPVVILTMTNDGTSKEAELILKTLLRSQV